MEEIIRPKDIQEKIAEVESWVKSSSETGVVGDLDRFLIKDVLEHFGANLTELDKGSLNSLKKYSNKGKHLGMQSVWEEKRKEFRDWTESWVKDYEERTGESLPQIIFTDKETGEKRPSKTEGLRHFFGEVTAYAANCLEFPDLKERLEARLFNFGKKAERRQILIPGYNKNKTFAPASIPKEFPQDAWGHIESWEKEDSTS